MPCMLMWSIRRMTPLARPRIREMADGAAEKHQEHVRNEKDDTHGPLQA